MTVFCGQKEVAFELEANLMLVFNATFNNFVIFHQINHAEIAHTTLTVDNVGVSQYLFDEIMTGLLLEGMDAFNLKY